MNPDEPTRPWLSQGAWSAATGVHAEPDLDEVRYRKDGELGRGGMGVVHLVTDRWLNRQVALKRPLDEAQVARVLREAEVTSRLNHPAIPPILDVGRDEQGAFYTMPVLRGAPLDRSSLSVLERVRAVQQLAEALQHAHQVGVVHRDVKPHNVLCGSNGAVWLVDWGVAWTEDEPDQDRVGTPGFMAPEQVDGRCSPASDVYGIGRVLQVAVADRLADEPSLAAIAEHACAADPEQRYPTAEAVAGELQAWLEGDRVGAYTYPLRELLAVYWMRHKVPITAAGLGLSAVLVSAMVGTLLVVRAQQSTERALGIALADQAAESARRGDLVQAELLAAQASEHASLPLARGIELQRQVSPEATEVRLACEDAVLETDGRQYCPSTWTIVSRDGRLTQVPEQDLPAEARFMRLVGDSPLFSWGEAARLVTPDGPVDIERQFVSQGIRVDGGAWPTLLIDRRVMRLSPEGVERVWESSCPDVARPRLVAGTPDGALVTCHLADRTYIESFDGDARRELVPPGKVSALLPTADGLAVALFDRRIALYDGSWQTWPSPGVIAGMSLLGERHLVLQMEHGPARLFDRVTRQWVADLPAGADEVFGVEDRIRWRRGDHVVDYRMDPPSSAPWLEQPELGGVDTLAVDPNRARVLLGHADGVTQLWDLDTGALAPLPHRGENVVKSAAFRPDGQLLISDGSPNVHSGKATHIPLYRTMETVDGKVLSIDWRGQLIDLQSMRSSPRDYTVLSLAAHDETLWMLTSEGTYRYQEEGATPHSADVVGQRLAVSEAGLFTAERGVLRAYAPNGRARWVHDTPHPITALEAGGDWVATGHRDGRVHIHRASDGELTAVVHRHGRRVADLRFVGDELLSASWDGSVQRLQLEPLARPPRSLQEVESRWGVELAELRLPSTD